MTGTERRIRLARALRIVFAVIAALDGLILAADLAQGSPVAAVPAACALIMLFLVIVETRLIGTLRRTQELTRRAEKLELAAEAARAKAGACAHPGAEPVDLSTGERVAWVCPDCDADLPAAWTPSAKGTGTLTATASVSARAALSGTGILSAEATATCDCPPDACAPVGVRIYTDSDAVARYCGACGKRIREDTRDLAEWLREQATASQGIPPARVATAADAAGHFEALARVGRESCLSYCPVCAERSRP